MQMRAGVALTLIFIGSLLVMGPAASPVSAAVIATSTFDSGTDGWTAITIDIAGNSFPSTVSFAAGAGNPGGPLRHLAPSESRTSYFSAPPFIVGALRSAQGGFVSWDISTINQPSDLFFSETDVEIRAGGARIRRNVTPPAPPTAGSYVRYTLGFNTGAGWLFFDGSTTTPASQAQSVDDIKAVLGSSHPLQAVPGLVDERLPPRIQEQVTGRFELGPLGGGDRPFSIERTNFKSFATEYHAQAPVALALGLRNKVSVEQIEAVDVRIYAMAHSEIGSEPAKWDPRTRETAGDSLPYMLAVTLTDGRVGPASFEPARYLDPGLRPLMSRIRVLEHPEFTRRFPQALVSEIEIRTRAGDRLVDRAEYPKGHARNPMTDADVVAKFRDLTGESCQGVSP